jgi:undecaprenyl-diphosphatase
LFSDLIDELLESPVTVAVSLLLGGIVLLKVDQWFNHSEDTKISDGIQNRIIPMPRNGSRVSRSGASIVGGMSQN